MASAPDSVTTTAVIPVHNGAAEIGRALSSVDAQTTGVDEIIVIDDGSSDDLLGALRQARFDGQLIRQAQRGQGAATNAGIARASTTHLLFIDHDDEWFADRVEWQVARISESEADIVIGGVVNAYSGKDGSVREVDMGPARLLGAGLFTREIFENVGLLPEDQRIHEIFDWWSRADGIARVVSDDHWTLRRHVHGANMTLRPEHRDRSDLLHRLRAHVHRDRVTDANH